MKFNFCRADKKTCGIRGSFFSRQLKGRMRKAYNCLRMMRIQQVKSLVFKRSAACADTMNQKLRNSQRIILFTLLLISSWLLIVFCQRTDGARANTFSEAQTAGEFASDVTRASPSLCHVTEIDTSCVRILEFWRTLKSGLGHQVSELGQIRRWFQ